MKNFDMDILLSSNNTKDFRRSKNMDVQKPNHQGVIEYLKIKDGGYPRPFDHNRCTSVSPVRQGWLEYKLTSQELRYVWESVEKKKGHYSDNLAGNNISSYLLEDNDNWFFLNTLCPLIDIYGSTYGNIGEDIPVTNFHPYFMSNWWVNFQKQNDFNPIHHHKGVYSFVIWLKIPIEFSDQNKENITNSPRNSSFCFQLNDMRGRLCHYVYQLGKSYEGTMLFFPSELQHIVYPFFNCSEDRISISGNILLDDR